MKRLLPLIALFTALLVVGCGSRGVAVAPSDPANKGAELFSERCSGCHTLDSAGTQGSRPDGAVNATDRTNGPNFNSRHVDTASALFAIRNGGYSGAVMPANVVVGKDAAAVALYINKYSGKKRTD